jgi:ferredoxin/siroheme synthase (precorrin-2 oxidase/ferrochelatase)
MGIKVKINGSEHNVAQGSTLLEVLNNQGIEVPTMCFLKNTEPFPTCMLCVVKDLRTGNLIPSCSTQVTDGMDIDTNDEEIKESRKTALELLLSEHVGECIAPCQNGCPAYMDIPEVNRLLGKGEFDRALEIVKNDIALPSVLGRICPAPCERGCRRKSIDSPVSIRLLERFAADHGNYDSVQQSRAAESNGKKIAIIGAGPAGLSAAYFLVQKGYKCEVFDKNPLAGGALRYAVPDDRLPKDVLDDEVARIERMGVILKMNHALKEHELEDIRKENDAVIIATGEDNADFTGLEKKHRSFIVERTTHKTNLSGVFAIGSAIKPGRVAVRAVANGKEVAAAVDQYLSDLPVSGEQKMFNSHIGHMREDDHEAFMMEAESHPRVDIEELGELSMEQMKIESSRCMHCDCRDKEDCKLRIYSDEYGAVQKRFFPKRREPIRKIMKHKPIIYEPEKCIKCGICVKITTMHNEKLGFTYIGKGFDVEIDVPFNSDGLSAFEKTAQLCIENCPTGALEHYDN